MARFDLAAAGTYVTVGETVERYESLARAVDRFARMEQIPAVMALAVRYPASAVRLLFSESENRALQSDYAQIRQLYGQAQSLHFAGNTRAAWDVMRVAAGLCYRVWALMQRRAPELASELGDAIGQGFVEAVRTFGAASLAPSTMAINAAQRAANLPNDAAEAASGAGKVVAGVAFFGLLLYAATRGKG